MKIYFKIVRLTSLATFAIALMLALGAQAAPNSSSSAPARPAWTPPDPMVLKDKEIGLLKQQLERSKGQLSQERLGRLVYETQLQVAALRGFGVTQPVKFAPLTREILDRIVDESIKSQYPGRVMDFYVWFNQLFAALPEKVDLPKLIKDLMGEQAAGVYDPHTQILYVKRDYPLESAIGRMVLAHEICHALQDQNHSLMNMGVEDVDNSDLALAALSVAEGDATLLMIEYMAKYGNAASLITELPKVMATDQQKLEQAPPAIKQAVLFPYMQGMQFFKTLDGRMRTKIKIKNAGSEGAWRDAIFADPPTTTQQILHPEKYLAKTQPAPIPPFKNGPLKAVPTTASARNVVGEFGITVLLGPLVGQTRAEQAAQGWNGDRLLVADEDPKGQRTLAWVTKWETPRDARAFAEALEEALKVRFKGELAWKGNEQNRTGETKAGRLEIVQSAQDTVELKGTFRIPKR